MSRHEQLHLFYSEFGPLVRKEAVAGILDCSGDHVLALLDEGRLRAANIASRVKPYTPEGGTAIVEPLRDLRFYRYSVIAFQADPAARLSRPPIGGMLPATGPDLKKATVAQILDCTERHVANLPLRVARYGSLRGTRLPRIDRDGLIEFLESREVRP